MHSFLIHSLLPSAVLRQGFYCLSPGWPHQPSLGSPRLLSCPHACRALLLLRAADLIAHSFSRGVFPMAPLPPGVNPKLLGGIPEALLTAPPSHSPFQSSWNVPSVASGPSHVIFCLSGMSVLPLFYLLPILGDVCFL